VLRPSVGRAGYHRAIAAPAQRPPLLRVTALLVAGAYSVHQARVAITGADAGGAAGSPVHDSLPLLAAAAIVVACLAAGHFAAALARARRGAVEPEPEPAALGRLWAQSTAALIAAHLLHELIERAAAGGAGGPFAGPGLVIAMLVAAAIGLLVALVLRGAHRVLAFAARTRRGFTLRTRPARPRCGASIFAPRRLPLACHLAGRAPPLAT
jgi:hypothetical protein